MRMRPGFEGGQMPLHRRLPKRGFTNIFKKRYAIVNLGDLAKLDPKEKVTPDLLVKLGVVGRLHDGLRVLGGGELSAPLQIAAHHFSKSAEEKIAKAGGKAEVISA
jgi:large subunit ribosomal protein L15